MRIITILLSTFLVFSAVSAQSGEFLTGFDDVPTTGETFIVMDDERTARQLVQQRLENQREANVSQQQKTNLENIFYKKA